MIQKKLIQFQKNIIFIFEHNEMTPNNECNNFNNYINNNNIRNKLKIQVNNFRLFNSNKHNNVFYNIKFNYNIIEENDANKYKKQINKEITNLIKKN